MANPKLLAAMLVVLTVVGLAAAAFAVGVPSDGAHPALPAFKPSMKDKFEKDENLRLGKTPTPSTPIPESEMAKLVVTEAWLIQNDEEPSPDTIKITFPKSWLNSPQITNDYEPIALLRVPENYLELTDTNDEPETITISYPVSMFQFYENFADMNKDRKANRPEPAKPQLQQQSVPAPANGFYSERAWYGINGGATVTGLREIIDPYDYYSDGRWFTNYNEREIYLNRAWDVIETISAFNNGDKSVWIAIYDEGVWVTPWNWLYVATPSLQAIEYWLIIDHGRYDMWFRDTSNNNWYFNQYNDQDNPSNQINWLAGSTELYYTPGSASFRTQTSPIQDWEVFAAGAWVRPNTQFYWHGYIGSEPYVYINTYWGAYGTIVTNHIASDSQS